MGFNGIAIGTIIAYVGGGLIQLIVLMRGTVVKLHLHRLRPHWITIKRLVRIGFPAMIEGVLAWLANFGVIAIINRMDSTNAMSSAHMNTIRIEGISFLSGMAFATAAATMVGTTWVEKIPQGRRARPTLRSAMAGAVMAVAGLLMITLGRYPAQWISPGDPKIIQLTTQCLLHHRVYSDRVCRLPGIWRCISRCRRYACGHDGKPVHNSLSPLFRRDHGGVVAAIGIAGGVVRTGR